MPERDPLAEARALLAAADLDTVSAAEEWAAYEADWRGSHLRDGWEGAWVELLTAAPRLLSALVERAERLRAVERAAREAVDRRYADNAPPVQDYNAVWAWEEPSMDALATAIEALDDLAGEEVAGGDEA